MTKKEIYEQVVRLTAEITKTDVASKVFEAAKEQNPKKIDEIFNNFKEQNAELYQQIVSFGNNFNEFIEESETKCEGMVFANHDTSASEEGLNVFDTKVINPLNFCIFLILAWIDDSFLFDIDVAQEGEEEKENSMGPYLDVLESEVGESLATFCACDSFVSCVSETKEDFCYPSISELLVAIVNGETDNWY